MLTVNGSHDGQLVSSESLTKLRGRAKKFKETLRGGTRLHPMVSQGKKMRDVNNLNQRQYPASGRNPQEQMRAPGF